MRYESKTFDHCGHTVKIIPTFEDHAHVEIDGVLRLIHASDDLEAKARLWIDEIQDPYPAAE